MERTASLQPLGVGDIHVERSVLTTLSYDLVGSTTLLMRMDIEDFQELMRIFQQAARSVIASCSGLVKVEAGDGGVALFSASLEARDAATLAIRAGLLLVDACDRINAERGNDDLKIRVGVATSMGIVEENQSGPALETLTGAAFALATRLQSMSTAGSVLVSDETRRLARRFFIFSFSGSHMLKGFVEPHRVWQALGHRRNVDRFFAFGNLASAFVGRQNELDMIRALWADAVTGRGGAVLIEGEAGIGKSRLVHEIRRATRRNRAKLLQFQCSPGGSHTALQPLMQSVAATAVQSGGQVTRDGVAGAFARQGVRDAEVVDAFSFLLGASGGADAGETDPKVIADRSERALRLCASMLCATGPVLLVVEDVHWADPTSIRMIEQLGMLAAGLPLLLVLTSRPDAAERFTTVARHHVVLGPLGHQETLQAVQRLWLGTDLAARPQLLELVERMTNGVPLFIEEACKWMVENTSAVDSGLTKSAPSSRVSMFETMLEARLHALGPAREVAHAAAVAGSRFTPELLGELLEEPDAAVIHKALESLIDGGFVIRSKFTAQSAYGFRHALIQEAIYASLLRKKRQAMHRRLFNAVDREPFLAPWLGTPELADQAERGGLYEKAVNLFVKAGTESYARSAMMEARHLLEHALSLCSQISDLERRDVARLSAMMVLGPILTATEGPNSLPARKLYDDGVALARLRPVVERSRWFPIYWGWWFTDTVVNGERAQVVLSDLREVDDPEVQLQARHCVWAIDFNLGRHAGCLSAVADGLPLYDPSRWRTSATLFGGHDARVCGLSHGGLSQWFTGDAAGAVRSLDEARRWALHIEHVGSIAHAYINEAMLHCYRRDFPALRAVVADIQRLTSEHPLPWLSATSQILEGWCAGNEGQLGRGIHMIRDGLALHAELRTPEDFPVYCGLLAELLVRNGERSEALDILSSAAAEAQSGGHRYWLAEIDRQRAEILLLTGERDAALQALEKSLALAAEQDALPVLIAAYEVLDRSGLSPALSETYRERADSAQSRIAANDVRLTSARPTHGSAASV